MSRGEGDQVGSGRKTVSMESLRNRDPRSADEIRGCRRVEGVRDSREQEQNSIGCGCIEHTNQGGLEETQTEAIKEPWASCSFNSGGAGLEGVKADSG